MGFLNDIFRPKAKPPSLNDAIAAVERLQTERTKAAAEISAANEKRKALLRDDDSDAEIEAIDREIARLELREERLEIAEPIAREALSEARNRARAAEWRRLAKVRLAADKDLAEKMRAALDSFNHLVKVTDQAITAGFGPEATAFAMPPRILDEDQISRFERASFRAESVLTDAARPKAATSAPAAASPSTPAPAAPIANAAAPAAKAAPKPPPETLPPHRLATTAPEPDADGKAVVLVFGPHAANAPFKHGEIIRVPHAEAMALVRGNVVGFVDPDSLVEPPREIASALVPPHEAAALVVANSASNS